MNPFPIRRNVARPLGLPRDAHLVSFHCTRLAGHVDHPVDVRLPFDDEAPVFLRLARHPGLPAVQIEQVSIFAVHERQREAPAVSAELLATNDIGIAQLDVAFAYEAPPDRAVEDGAIGFSRFLLGKGEKVVSLHERRDHFRCWTLLLHRASGLLLFLRRRDAVVARRPLGDDARVLIGEVAACLGRWDSVPVRARRLAHVEAERRTNVPKRRRLVPGPVLATGTADLVADFDCIAPAHDTGDLRAALCFVVDERVVVKRRAKAPRLAGVVLWALPTLVPVVEIGRAQYALPVDDFRAVQLLVRCALAEGHRPTADASDENGQTWQRPSIREKPQHVPCFESSARPRARRRSRIAPLSRDSKDRPVQPLSAAICALARSHGGCAEG